MDKVPLYGKRIPALLLILGLLAICYPLILPIFMDLGEPGRPILKTLALSLCVLAQVPHAWQLSQMLCGLPWYAALILQRAPIAQASDDEIKARLDRIAGLCAMCLPHGYRDMRISVTAHFRADHVGAPVDIHIEPSPSNLFALCAGGQERDFHLFLKQAFLSGDDSRHFTRMADVRSSLWMLAPKMRPAFGGGMLHSSNASSRKIRRDDISRHDQLAHFGVLKGAGFRPKT